MVGDGDMDLRLGIAEAVAEPRLTQRADGHVGGEGCGAVSGCDNPVGEAHIRAGQGRAVEYISRFTG